MAIKDRIQKIRQALGLSLEQFAYGLKISTAEAADYESGTHIPSEEIQDLICVVYGISEKWLSAGEGKMFVQETDNMSYRWFMLWDPSGKYDPSHLWLVDKVTGFTDLKIDLLAEIAEAMR